MYLSKIKIGMFVYIDPDVENIQKPKRKGVRRKVVEISPAHHGVKMYRVETLGGKSKTKFWYKKSEISLKPFN